MKPKVLIIAFLIISLLGAFTIKVHSQFGHRSDGSHIPVIDKKLVAWGCIDTTLIADETRLTYNKTGAKIICDNENVFNLLFKSHGTIFQRFTCSWKTDRYGRYKHYTIYLSKEDAEIIVNWAKTNL